MKELNIHIQQCMAREDELRSLLINAARGELQDAGYTSIREAFLPSTQGPRTNSRQVLGTISPLLRLQHYVKGLGEITQAPGLEEIKAHLDPNNIAKLTRDTLNTQIHGTFLPIEAEDHEHNMMIATNDKVEAL